MRLACRFLTLLGLFLALLAPTVTHASELSIATDAPRKPRRETMEREGPVFGFGVSPGVALLPRGFMPAMRFHGTFGAALTHRVMLEADLGGTRFIGRKRGGFNGDLVLTGVIGRGLFLRAGIGGTSHSPAAAGPTFRPGIGGLVGLGYDFDIADGEGASIALGVDYDARLRTDGRLSQMVLLGLRVRLLPAMK